MKPDKIVAARSGPPNRGRNRQGEYFLALDVPAVFDHTRDIFFLADGDTAVLTRDGVEISDLQGTKVHRPVNRIKGDPITAERGATGTHASGIREQPRGSPWYYAGVGQPSDGRALSG